MTGPETNEPTNTSEESIFPAHTPTIDWYLQPDFQLQRIAHAANDYGRQISITFFMPWGMAAGTTCANGQMFSAHAELLRATQPDNQAASSFAEVYLDPAAKGMESLAERDYTDEELVEVLERTAYLTLKDVQCSFSDTLVAPDRIIRLPNTTFSELG